MMFIESILITIITSLSIQTLFVKLNQRMRYRDHSSSTWLHRGGDTYYEQEHLNNDFHEFVRKYREAYMGPNTAAHQIGSPVDKGYCKIVQT